MSHFTFQKNDSIGAPAAEDDVDFLRDCFVDTGDLTLLNDMTDRRLIVLGRTGSGKTALLSRLQEANPSRVIVITPHDLALTYLSNSTILTFFTDLGVNLDPFFKLLWRHVFTVEILSRFFEQHTQEEPSSIFDRMRSFFAGTTREDKQLQQAVQYLEEWGKSFWSETEYRVKEITQKVEHDLESVLHATVGEKWLSAGGSQTKGQKLSEEQRVEVIKRAQEVVSAIQVKDLHQASALLGKVLSDKQKNYWLVVDRLDEDWVEDRLRYKLIMGLIHTAREFIGVSHAKIVIALRRDLIDRVFRLARDAGFQEEKIRGLYLPLTWTKGNILELLERRVTRMVRRRYTKEPVTYTDLLPDEFEGKSIGDFIYSVANRPRDVIAFFNICIHAAVDRSKLSSKDLTKALGEYSQSRLRALADEWYADCPHLLDFASLLKGRPRSFKVDALSRHNIEEICLSIVSRDPESHGILFEAARAVADGHTVAEDFRTVLLDMFYRIGLVGLKVSPESAPSWADELGQAVTSGQITETSSVVVSPKYVNALGVR